MTHRLVARFFILFFALMTLSGELLAQTSPLVSADWLKANLQKPDIRILDFRPQKYYAQGHIPGAIQTDYAGWRRTNSAGLGKMLPEPDLLSKLISGLGIDNDTHVVITPGGRGAGDMAAAARIYWTLYVAGLDKLSILEGGVLRWYQQYGAAALQQGNQEPQARDFVVNIRQEQIMDMDKVTDYIKEGLGIVDARSRQEFLGLVSGGANERPGALPGAINLPYDQLMNADQSALKSVSELKAQFEKLGIPDTGPHLSYCHTGHRTSLFWFVAHELLANSEARLYDGSTLEWAVTPDKPLVVRQAARGG